MDERDLIRSLRHRLEPRTDAEIEQAAEATGQVDRAVGPYQRRLATGQWTDWLALVPADVRDAVRSELERAA